MKVKLSYVLMLLSTIVVFSTCKIPVTNFVLSEYLFNLMGLTYNRLYIAVLLVVMLWTALSLNKASDDVKFNRFKFYLSVAFITSFLTNIF